MKTYFSAFAVLLAVAVGNYVGQEYNVALHVPFYDVYLHLGGGLGIGLMLLAMLRSYKHEYASTNQGHRLVVLGIILVGIIWELFEAYFNIAGAPVGTKAYWLDTLKDIIDDIIGGSLALFLSK
jgi:hypothetical protein